MTEHVLRFALRTLYAHGVPCALLSTAYCLLLTVVSPVYAQYAPVTANDVVDLSPTISARHYQYWPGGQLHHQPLVVPYITHGPGPWASDLIILDENTATQTDTPAHMMSPQDSGLPNAHYWGSLTNEKIPAWQLLGEVYKIDGRQMLDQANNGESPLFTLDHIKVAEQAYRAMGPGDAVLYWSGYDDKYDRPMPEGSRLIIDPMVGTAPGWPAPNFDAAEYVGSRGVRLMGLDSPSMGALGPPQHIQAGPAGMFQNPLALESHLGHFKYGAIHTEGLMNLDKVPNGSLYIALPVKHENSPTVETRAIAITNQTLAADLLKAVKGKRVADLSVVLSMRHPVWWPGRGLGHHVFPYSRIQPVNYFDGPFGPYWVNTHMMDSQTGTHVDPPAHYGPPPGFDDSRYDAETRATLGEFEARYGKLKRTEMTSEKVPLHHYMGPARVINVQHRVGTTTQDTWPASPRITVEDIESYEKIYGSIKAGDVVLFHTGHTDTHFRRFERDQPDLCVKGPLDGLSEGWPAPTPEVINYLAEKGVKHVGIDAPDMGPVNAKASMMTHWAAVNQDMIFTEYLIGVGQLPPTGAFYIFLNPKVENNHGGPGRAIAILP